LTAHLKNVSLGQVFELIQQQSEYIIFYKDNQVDLTQLVSVNAENGSIEKVLEQALKRTGLKYKIFDRQVIIVHDKDLNSAANMLSQANTELKKKNIMGRVVDEYGIPLYGVTVVVKGTYFGVITNEEGIYALDVPEDALLLTFSFVGLKTIEENLKDRTVIDVTLFSENYGVEEVVISALGLKRAEKALSYSTQTIRMEDIAGNKDLNFANGLSGKISGIEISRSAAGAGGSTKVILRGNKSLSESSEPLFVIDGIPMANNKGGQLGMFGGSDGGDGLSQINTDDIESITILKGANAAALYGSQGANGVIVITTKKGVEGLINASYSSALTFEQIQKTPDLQFDYGGMNGSVESWSTTKGNYARNYVDDFFRTGSTLINSLTISGGGDRTTVYFSFSNTSINGIVSNNNYKKNNITFKQSTLLFDDKLSVSSNLMLINELTKNKGTAGYYLNPLTGLYLFPRDKDFASYEKNFQVFDTSRNMYLQNWFVTDHFQSNPNWIINNQKREDLAKRLIASINTGYAITDHMNLQLRASYDYAIKTYEEKNKAGSNATNVHPNGSWTYQKYSDELIYADAIFTYHRKLNDLSFDAVLGTSYLKSKSGAGISVITGTDGLIYPNEFSFQNIEKNVLVNSIIGSNLIKEGVFGNIQLGYKEKLFLDISGRNDWASSLYGTGNDSYFYPSIGLTGIVSEMVELPEFMSFGKIRGAYTVVANDVPFNKVNPGNTITSTGISINTTKPFTNLKPEMLYSFEAGTDIRFFNGLFGVDFTYYNINSKDQFITLPAPSGSGYTQYFVNAGKVTNSGIEITMISESMRTKDFGWLTSLNFSANRNKIVSLHPDLKEPISLTNNEGYQLVIKEGGSFGDIYVHKFLRDENGRIMLDAKGNILKTAEKEYIGNSNPNWSLGLNNKFRYKNLTFGFLFNSKIGGKVVSQTEAMLDGYGVSERTALARDNGGVIVNAVMPDGTIVNRMDAKQYYSSIGGRDGIKEPYTFSRTNIRLAQVLLSYDLNFPYSAIKKASFSITGQNLFFIYKDAPFDPEITMNTLILDQALDNFSLPSTRTFGFNFKILF
jgi:TonB-linked SusC/RagA family outer membrane protein